MLVPHLHLYNRAGFRDNAAKSGKPGHNRDIGPNSGTVPAKPGHLPTMTYIHDFKTLAIERISFFDVKCTSIAIMLIFISVLFAVLHILH